MNKNTVLKPESLPKYRENNVMQKKSCAHRVYTRRNRVLPSMALLAVFVFALTACDQKAAPKPREAQVVEVVAYTVEHRQVPVSSELTGRVAAAVTADIRPQTGGIVRKLLFKEGSNVTAGQTLYEIDPTSAQTSVSDAEATLSSALVAQASAKSKAARYRKLVDIEAVSQESAEEANAAYKQAVSSVASAQANLKAAKTTLSYANVTSPIDGRIGRSNVSEGTLVIANQTTALATVQQLGSVYLDATQSAAEFLRIRQQFEKGEVKLETVAPVVRLVKGDGSLYEQTGTLELDDAIVDQTTGSVTVRTLFPNPNNELIPGMYGKIRLEGAVIQNALVVPQVAVSRDVKGNALAEYELVIQTAFREVSDALSEQSNIQDLLAARQSLLEANEKIYRLTDASFRNGLESSLLVLTAQRSYNIAEQELIAARLTEALNWVTLYRVLGGGWKS